MSNKLFLLTLFCFPFFVFAQVDTLKKYNIEEFIVSGEPIPNQIFAIQPLQKMNKEKIDRLSSLQLSDVVKHLAGTIVKDYGGIGGMKTVSVRGLGANHTGVVYDGVALSDCQTGQIDIGKISMEFIESITLSNGLANQIFSPARQYSYGAVMNIYPESSLFQNQETTKVKFSLLGGSYGFLNPTLKISQRIFANKCQKWNCIATFKGSYVTLKGDFPYTLFFGGSNDSTSTERRTNADMQSINTEASLFLIHKQKKESFKINIFYYHSERGLPGAALYYNLFSDQRLWDANAFVQAKYTKFFSKKWGYSSIAKVNHSYIRYLDPSFLNSEGKLDNRYTQNEYYLSNSFIYMGENLDISFANDLFYNNLFSNAQFFIQPSRFNILTSASAEWRLKWLKISSNLLHTLAINSARLGESAPNYQKLSPTFGFSIKPYAKKDFYVRAFYKNIFRLPTFNDLYYREFGNLNLKPENTSQFSSGITYFNTFYQGKITLSATLDAYYNLIENKIVAIPNKNLFIWTMINYGVVHAKGIDATLQSSYKIAKNFEIHILGSYTFQKAVDLTTPGSKTYNNQLPYTPLHSGSTGISITTKLGTLSYNTIISGERYVLGQNIPQNLLQGYLDHSVSFGKDFLFKNNINTNSYRLGVKLEVINFTNEQYQIVRNYPMPGRHYRIKLILQ